MSTNAAYKELAYRKALLRYTVNLLMTNVVGVNGSPPKETIICEDVFEVDREVDQDHVLGFTEELQLEESQVRLEMSQFGFGKKDDQSKLTTRRKTGNSRKRPKARKAKAKAK